MNKDNEQREIMAKEYPACGCPADLFCECSRKRILIRKALNDAFVAGRSKQAFSSFEKEWHQKQKSS